MKITPELDSEPRERPSNGQLGLWDRLEPEPRVRNQPVEVNLLIELEQEANRWRLRTIFLASIMFHLVIAALLYASSGFIRHQQELALLEAQDKKPEPMFLYMPPDLLKQLKQKPKTPVLSDKDRLARGKAPLLDPKAPEIPFSKGNTKLPEIAGGPPKMASPPPAPPAQKPAEKSAEPPPKQTEDALKLEDVPKPPSAPGHLAMATPEEAIQQSLQAAAQASRGRARSSGPGDSMGQFSNPNSNFSVEGPTILSDTQGVDFGPYLARIVEVVRRNWYTMMPESARLGQRGRVALQFSIQKDGRVPEVDMVASSGANALDEAAGAAIHLSVPFPPLPEEFKGNELKLRFIFLYNLGYGPQ